MKAYAKVEVMEGTFYTRKSVKGVILLILKEHEWMKYGKKTCTLILHNELIIKETVRSVRNNLDFFHKKNSKGFDLNIINLTQIALNQCGRFNFNILVKSFQILYWKCP